MKTLICISSKLRADPLLCFSSIIKHVIRPLPEKPDIIGYLSPPSDSCVEIFNDHCNVSEFIFESDPTFPKHYYDYDTHMGWQKNGIHTLLLQWHSMKQCLKAKQEIERSNGKYDLVFWVRPDLYFLQSILNIAEFSKNTIYLNRDDSWGAYNDRFCYSSSEIMDKRMGIMDYFLNEWYPETISSLQDNHDENSFKWNPEYVLGCMIQNKIQCKVNAAHSLALRMRRIDNKNYLVLPSHKGLKNFGYDSDCKDPQVLEKIYSLSSLINAPHSLQDAPGKEKKLYPLEMVEQHLMK